MAKKGKNALNIEGVLIWYIRKTQKRGGKAKALGVSRKESL